MLIAKLRAEYAEGVVDIKKTLAQNCTSKNDKYVSSSSKNNEFSTASMKLCVTLKCIAGGHLGQKFRLEPTTVSSAVGNSAMLLLTLNRRTVKMSSRWGVQPVVYSEKRVLVCIKIKKYQQHMRRYNLY